MCFQYCKGLGAHWGFRSHQERVRRPLISLFLSLGNELETSGWIHLIISWVGILGLVLAPRMAAAVSDAERLEEIKHIWRE